MIRLTIPSIEEDDIEAAASILQSGLLVQGEQVAKFEKAIASYVGTEYAIAVSSGTAALHCALLAIGIGTDDLVIIPAFSWTATANAVELCGGRPIFVDIDIDTYNLCTTSLEIKVREIMNDSSNRRKLKCIMPVHAFGQMADMEKIMEIADHYKISVIEDAACALGASINGRQAGTWGVMGCFSFHPRKAITTGEGGIIATNRKEFVNHIHALRNHGQEAFVTKPDFIIPGYNYRITEFQAAIGLTQLSKLDRIIQKRRQLASFYNENLPSKFVKHPVISANSNPVHQAYVVLLLNNLSERRHEIIEKFKGRGIETTIGTVHIPLTKYYSSKYGYKPGDFPVCDQVSRKAWTLPLYESLTNKAQKQILEQVLSLGSYF
jgi:dTDP-4-amino-4,6-dideoxygalactose transaminase